MKLDLGDGVDFWNGVSHVKLFSQTPRYHWTNFFKDAKQSAVLFRPPGIFRLKLSLGGSHNLASPKLQTLSTFGTSDSLTPHNLAPKLQTLSTFGTSNSLPQIILPTPNNLAYPQIILPTPKILAYPKYSCLPQIFLPTPNNLSYPKFQTPNKYLSTPVLQKFKESPTPPGNWT